MLRERTFIGYKEENKKNWGLLLGMLLMSVVLGWFIYKTRDGNQNTPTEIPQPTAIVSLKPLVTIKISPTLILVPTKIVPTSTPTVVKKQVGGQITPTPTETQQIYVAANDGFSVIYKSNRTIIKDSIGGVNRYTFYDIRGSMAVHVSNNWSWSHPNRSFNNNYLVDNHNTFVYEISDQKIIDVENGEKKYTIQCVHNGLKDLVNECNAFAKSFKFM